MDTSSLTTLLPRGLPGVLVLALGCGDDPSSAADGSSTAVVADETGANGQTGTTQIDPGTDADGTANPATGTGTGGGSGATAGSGGSGTDSGTTGTPLGDVGSGATVYYEGKVVDVTDFSPTGLDLGKYGYYFPQFGQSTPKTKRRARDNMQFVKPTWQRDWEFKVFELCNGEFCNLFSPDAGVFDVLEGEEGIGVYSESEGAAWAYIQIPGAAGNSGSVVDEAANGNSNNSVNHIRIADGAPSEFCMAILTDNTAGAHDINGALAARIGWYPDVDLETGTADVPAGDLVFNGIPDLYVFRFANMTGEDFIKIRLRGNDGTDPGFGGLMFDPCE